MTATGVVVLVLVVLVVMVLIVHVMMASVLAAVGVVDVRMKMLRAVFGAGCVVDWSIFV